MSKLLTLLRDLSRRKARERRGLALIEGVRLVEEALAAGLALEGAVVSPALEATDRGRALQAALTARGVPLEPVDAAQLAELADTEHPQGIVAAVTPPAWTLAGLGAGPVLVLDAVQDPGNVGTMLRTALALGAGGVVALPGTAELANPKVLRAAMGAAFRLPHLAVEERELLAWAAAAGRPLWATAMDGEDVRRVPVDGAAPLLVLGNEGAGVRATLAEAAARRVAIPIAPGAESLNVATAAALFLWEFARAR